MAEEVRIKASFDQKDAVNGLVDIEKGAKKASVTIKDLEAKAEKLNKELEGLDIGSKEFQKLAEEARKVDAELKNANAQMEGFSSRDRVGALGDIYSGITQTTGGFALFASTLGDGNEALEENLNKFVAYVGLIDSSEGVFKTFRGLRESGTLATIKNTVATTANTVATNLATTANKLFGTSIDTSTNSLKGFKTALIATGIGAVVVAIGTLVAYWDDLSEAISGSTEAQQLNNDIQSKAVDAASEELNALDLLSRKINDNNTSREDQLKAVEDFQSEYPDLLANIDAEKASLDEVNQSILDYSRLVFLRAQAAAAAEIAQEALKEQMQEQISMQNEQNAGLWEGVQAFAANTTGYGENVTAQQVANAQSNIFIAQKEKERNAALEIVDSVNKEIEAKEKLLGIDKDSKEASKEAEAAAKEAAEEAKKRREEARKSAEKAAAEEKRLRDQELEDKRRAAEEEQALQDEYWLRQQEDRDQEEVLRMQQYEKEIAAANNNAELERQLTEELQSDLQEIRDRYDKVEVQEAFDQQQRIDEAKIAAREARLQDGDVDGLLALNESRFQEEMEALTFQLEQGQITQDEFNALEEQKKAEHEARITQIERDAADEREQIDNDLKAAKIKIANDTFSLISNISELFAGEDEERARKAFEVDKAARIASATTSGIEGTINAFKTAADSPITKFFPAYPAIQAGIAGAFAATNIAKIARTKFKGGSTPPTPPPSPGGGFSAPNTGGAPVLNPTLQQTGGGDTQLAGSNQVAPASVTKVFVLESDITTAQGNVASIEEAATFN